MRRKLTATISVSVFILVVSCLQVRREPSPERLQPSAELGRGLYGMHCAVCHGMDGDGKGVAAPHLFPPARDFGTGNFRLVSTANGAPTTADLVRTMRRGIPGSAMPSWDWLSQQELESLAAYVRELSIAGFANRARIEAIRAKETFEPGELEAAARLRLEPGRQLLPPSAILEDESSLVRGRELYNMSCASCHLDDGSGNPLPLIEADGRLNWPRDFTAGFMKGGATPRELANRIRAGMPGSAMPATNLNSKDLAALVTYVGTMIPEGAEDRLVRRRKAIFAARSDTSLPDDPAEIAWSELDETLVALAPMWWRQDAVLHAAISATHDGDTLALRLRWPDESGKSSFLADVTQADALALQFSNATAPPTFGMGAGGLETVIWHWKSIRLSEVAGELDLVASDLLPGGERIDVPIQDFSGTNLSTTSTAVHRLNPSGVETVPATVWTPTTSRILARWESGEWEITFLRSLCPSDRNDVEFRPGVPIQMSCAIWNGAAGDEGAEKSISLWQELTLE